MLTSAWPNRKRTPLSTRQKDYREASVRGKVGVTSNHHQGRAGVYASCLASRPRSLTNHKNAQEVLPAFLGSAYRAPASPYQSARVRV